MNAGILRILPPPAAPGRQAEPSQLCKTLGRDRDYRHAGSNCHSAILHRNLTEPRPVHWSSRKQAYFISTPTPRQYCLSSLGCRLEARATQRRFLVAKSVLPRERISFTSRTPI